MLSNVMRLFSIFSLFAVTVVQAEVVDVAPGKILAYLKSQKSVVVQFNSPGKGCKPCLDAYAVFDRFAEKHANRSTFVRVEWLPYTKIPKDIQKKFRLLGMPAQLCFRDGKKVGTYMGLMKEGKKGRMEKFEQSCF